MKKTMRIILTILLLSMLTVGCSSNNKIKEVDLNKIGIRGYVTDIDTNEKHAIITVEGNLENDTIYDKAVVEIIEDTLIQKDNLSRLFDISDIEEGIMVEVIFKGGVKEVYPVQGTADIVRMITSNSQN